MKAKNLCNLTVLGLFCLLLSACNVTQSLKPFKKSGSVLPACPTVKILQDADKITVYRDGPGRDITDILHEAKLTGFMGECEYIGEDGVFTEVIVSLRVKFNLMRGPAEKKRFASLQYFVAIPEFFPAPEGKKQFSRRVGFPAGRNNVTFIDDYVEIRIPISKDRKGPGSRIYIGFELTRDQLNLNRRQGSTPSLGG